MRTILCSIFEMSLTATLLILILVLFRPVLKKIPAWIRCGIWAMPAVRLLCPFSVKSSFSIIPDWKELNPFAVSYDTGRPFSDNIVTAYQFGDSTLNMAGSGTPQAAGNFDFMQLLFVIWLAGIAAMAGYMIFGTLYLKKRTSVSVEIKQHVFLCDEIDTPFVSGILRPKIYMPSGLDAETMENAEAHEQAHIKRFDYLWKLMAFAALALHWFNPAAWLGYILFCRDIELACDENVVKGLSQEEKVQYSQSILNCSARKRSSYLYTVGFSETAVRDRVKHIFNYRSPSFKAIAGTMIFCILFMGMLMTNPFMEEENDTDTFKYGTLQSSEFMKDAVSEDTTLAPPEIYNELPSFKTVTKGEDNCIEIGARGTGTLCYNWLVDGKYYASATSDSFNTRTLSPGEHEVMCNVYTRTGNKISERIYSNACFIYVGNGMDALSEAISYDAPGMEIKSDLPAEKTVIFGQDATVSVLAEADYGILYYEWYVDGKLYCTTRSNSFNTKCLSVGKHSIYCNIYSEYNGTTSGGVGSFSCAVLVQGKEECGKIKTK